MTEEQLREQYRAAEAQLEWLEALREVAWYRHQALQKACVEALVARNKIGAAIIGTWAEED